nr:MAG TPA: hypothetical protein [Inoviridae sp.]
MLWFLFFAGLGALCAGAVIVGYGFGRSGN